MSRKQISPKRKGVFYLGMALTVIGAISFGSVFVSAAMESAGFMRRSNPFMAHSNGFMDLKWAPARAFGRILLIVAGQMLSRIGRMGIAGAGVILDPQKARRDIEPWSRMGGGVIKDALDEAEIKLGSGLPFDEQLRRLHQLRVDGLISDAEYQAKRKRILERI